MILEASIPYYLFLNLFVSASGGGGERVLWMMVLALLRLSKSGQALRIVIYTGDTSMSKMNILNIVKVKLTSYDIQLLF